MNLRKRKQQKMESIVNPLHHEAEIKANLTNLPDEVLLMIFSFLSKSDLVSLSQTCQGLKHLALDPSLWTELILKYEAIRKSTWACRKLVSRCTMLKHLTITSARPDIESDRVMSIVLLRKDTLTSLKIDDARGLQNSAMTQLSMMTNLRHLAICGLKLEASGLLLLTNLTELEEFLILPRPCGCFKRCSDNVQCPRPRRVRPLQASTIAAIKLLAKRMKKLRILKIPGLSFEQVPDLVKRNPHLEQIGNWVFTWGKMTSEGHFENLGAI